EEAIALLGRGFLAHPANADLRARLRSGALSKHDYYRQLLRLVYRLIFVWVAEDRDLLLSEAADTAARRRYREHYALRRLRDLAGTQRGGPHPDLYRAARQVFALLHSGYEPLALPALGGNLFKADWIPDLETADLANAHLLAAVRALAYTTEGRTRRPVDYRSLGAEELGSVYESLLELQPDLNADAPTFALVAAAGSERKTTGSYYTPTSLIDALLDSALEPVVADRLAHARADPSRFTFDVSRLTPDAKRETSNVTALEQAILGIKVVDPACGSGHFLVAAAHRLARHLARIRSGDEEPAPAALRKALRDVVSHCIHGVDLNEMAVELCKIALWMETLDPGRPLGFLERNIRCGNSLIGATPALLRGGIPDEAFTPIEGDDKALCSEYRRRNQQERAGQLSFLRADLRPWERLGDLAAAMAGLEQAPEDTLTAVESKQQRYDELVRSHAYRFGRLWADAWCAAFFWRKADGFPPPLTEGTFRKIERNPYSVDPWTSAEIERLAAAGRYLHWHLAFPHVFRLPGKDEPPENAQTGWSGGFDVVLGNPPWEHTELKEKEWFASRRPDIAAARTGAERKRMIDALAGEDPALHEQFLAARREHDAIALFAGSSGRYPLCGRGRINTYAVFAELARQLLASAGRAGIIVPSGIATDDTTKHYFQEITSARSLVSLYDFENRDGIFPGVH
ncbi:MAG: Eco57I restriction-modification methylase domain-containing protein, partial [Thiobacillaceae bacterium]